jgi:branched-subunit amino acid transport protein
MYRYIFFTWLITNLIHPVVAIIYFGGLSEFFDSGFVPIYFFIFIYSLFISSVSLLLSFLFLSVVLKMKIPDWCKLLCWLAITPLIIIVNLVVFIIMADGNGKWTFGDAEIGIPAMITIVVVILARYNYFIKMCEESRMLKAGEEL